MATTKSAAMVNEAQAEPIQKPAPTPRDKPKTKRQPPYAVILHNDDVNGMDHVVRALRKVFHYSLVKAIGLMLKAHVSGKVIVWSGALEVAELKADQLRSCGPDPMMKRHGATTLSVTVEPLPQ